MRPSSWWIPLLFAVAAAGANFAVLRTVREPVPLVAAKTDLKAGKPLREENLTIIPVTAAPEALQSLLHQADLGKVVQKTLNRDLKAGELVLMRDVRSSAEDITGQLLPNESTLTLSVPGQRVASDLRPGDLVVCMCPEVVPQEGNRPTGVILRYGPFRLLGVDLPSNDRMASRKITLAVRMMPPDREGKVSVEPSAAAILFLRTSRGVDDRVQGVERYNPSLEGVGRPALAPPGPAAVNPVPPVQVRPVVPGGNPPAGAGAEAPRQPGGAPPVVPAIAPGEKPPTGGEKAK